MNEILKLLKERDNFIITSHIRPDGDSIGSQISLFFALKDIGKNVTIVNEDSPPLYLSFLPYLDTILQPDDERKDIAIILDTNEPERLGKRTKGLIEKTPLKINIDHHVGKGIGNINWMDEDVSSVCEMIYSLIKPISEKPISPDISLLLYVGIATDTGFFSFRNTTSKALRICAELLDAGMRLSPSEIKEHLYSTKTIGELRLFGKALLDLKSDGPIVWTQITEEMIEEANKDPETDTLLDTIRGIKDASVIVLFRELSPSRTKVSLRSKEDFDVREIAVKFGGGGHLCAAGCILPFPIKEAEQKIIKAIKEDLLRRDKIGLQ